MDNKDFLYSTSDLALAAVISIFHPLKSIDKDNPKKVLFIFQKDNNLDKLIEKYYAREQGRPAEITYYLAKRHKPFGLNNFYIKEFGSVKKPVLEFTSKVLKHNYKKLININTFEYKAWKVELN